MAIRMGLEPTTSAVTGRHSNQLNYRTVLACVSALDYNNISFSKMQYLFRNFLKFFYFYFKQYFYPAFARYLRVRGLYFTLPFL